MTEDRLKELRARLGRWDVDIGETKNEVEECLAEIERLRAALEYTASFTGDEDCTTQLAVMARVALEGK